MDGENALIPEWKIQGNYKLRRYDDYEKYSDHQKSKLDGILDWVKETQKTFVPLMRGRIKIVDKIPKGSSVLCLGARLGGEVKAFIGEGCFAVGVDLNPGKDNRYVLQGDFHNLQFPDKCVDVVFCNSLDHVLMMDSFISEIKRVLKDSGLCIIEPTLGYNEGGVTGPYESIAWDSIETLVNEFISEGFEPIVQMDMNYPHEGRHIVLRKKE